MGMGEMTKLEDSILARVRFGRNRFLKLAGTGLAGLAVQVFVPKQALAAHGNIPQYCSGFGVCHCCSGTECCESRCSWPSTPHTHCSSGGQCWNVCTAPSCSEPCASTGTLYRCCDWHCGDCNQGHCICRANIGTCCKGLLCPSDG
ncbi:MAG TPA: hypothetical protein VHN37_14065 [Actinomycetota bacterium]|nr:hypothetical protein [Actinomycetota bacterium]